MLIMEDDVTIDATGKRGRWVTIAGGRRVFIASTKEVVKSDLKRLKKASTATLDKQVVTTQDGREITKYVYPEGVAQKKAQYKFARVAALLSERDKIEKKLRTRVRGMDRDSDEPPTKDQASALALLLISTTGIRAGEGETDGKATYAATSLERRHVSVKDNNVQLSFRGKAGVQIDLSFDDEELATGLRQCLGGKDSDPSGASIFQYEGSDGRPVSRDMLIRDLRGQSKIGADHYKLHDLRTCKALEVASQEVDKILGEEKPEIPFAPEGAKSSEVKAALKARRVLAKGYIDRVATAVSDQLKNTPSVAMADYTEPALIESMLESLGFAEPGSAGKGKFDVK